jgi:LPS-assembly protein
MPKLPPFFLFLLASSTAGGIAAAEQPAPASAAPAFSETNAELTPGNVIEIEGASGESEMEHSFGEGITYYRRGVIVRYGTTELVANQVALSEASGDIIADGNVRLQNEAQHWAGEHLEYNFRTGKIHGENFRTGFAPFFAQGLQLDGSTDKTGEYVARQTFITTDDIKNPGFKIRAKSFRIINGERVEAKDATIYIGDTPVMRLPFYRRTLQTHESFWRLTPGYRSLFGPFLLSEYHFPVTTNLMGAVKLDLYQRRGVGLGSEFAWKVPRWGDGEFQYYYIDDSKPQTNPSDGLVENDRHRIRFSHRLNLRPNLTAKVVVREQSDPFLIRDFFETEYRENTQPRTFLEVNQLWSNWSLDVLAQAQVNDFFQTVERLPDIKLSGIRQQIGETSLFYESESSAAYLGFEPGLENVSEYSAMRLDSFHQILWPQNYFGWLNFVPRVGGRFTQYGETEGPGSMFEERSRFTFNTGAEVSTKASRVWRGARSRFWDVNELRHIVEPSVNYVFVPEPNYQPNELPQFDREIPSLRLLPIDFPDYNAIDSIDSQNVVRFGLRNKFQTKREDGIQNLVNWAVYTDWRLNPRPGQTTFADIYSDLDLRPRSWLSLSSETRFDVKTREWNAAYHTATIQPNATWSLRLGHRYFRGGPEFGPESDNNAIFSSLYYKFNENWGTRITHHFEARDGTMEEQYYTLYRDFRSWTAALTFRLREHRERSNDFAVGLTFQLKAFPRFKLGDDSNQHSFLLGG